MTRTKPTTPRPVKGKKYGKVRKNKIKVTVPVARPPVVKKVVSGKKGKRYAKESKKPVKDKFNVIRLSKSKPKMPNVKVLKLVYDIERSMEETNEIFALRCGNILEDIADISVIELYMAMAQRILSNEKNHHLVMTSRDIFQNEQWPEKLKVADLISIIGEKNYQVVKSGEVRLGVTCECKLLHFCENKKEREDVCPVSSIRFEHLMSYTFGDWMTMTDTQQNVVCMYYAYQIWAYRGFYAD